MDEKITENKKNYDILDLVKLILSFMVVAIHAKLFDPYLYPWLRLAVPLFFMISSYLFFSKVKLCQSKEEKLQALKKFTLRNIYFYAFWFIVLFPLTAILRGWFNQGILNGIVTILINLFIGSTFVASWFISALVIGTAIVFLASKKLNNLALFIIGAVLYLLISIRSSYMFVFKDWIEMLQAVATFEAYLGSPINAFPAGIFWIICGKIFADGGFKMKIKPCAVLLGASLGLLLAEWLLLKHFSGNYNKDFYIMLAPSCLAFFNILINLKPITIKHAQKMRKISAFTYASHGTLIIALNYISKRTVGQLPSVVIFLTTIAICVGACLLVLLLEKRKYFTWLKYSH